MTSLSLTGTPVDVEGPVTSEISEWRASDGLEVLRGGCRNCGIVLMDASSSLLVVATMLVSTQVGPMPYMRDVR